MSECITWTCPHCHSPVDNKKGECSCGAYARVICDNCDKLRTIVGGLQDEVKRLRDALEVTITALLGVMQVPGVLACVYGEDRAAKIEKALREAGAGGEG
jgi:hypothetical protein